MGNDGAGAEWGVEGVEGRKLKAESSKLKAAGCWLLVEGHDVCRDSLAPQAEPPSRRAASTPLFGPFLARHILTFLPTITDFRHA